MRTYFWLSYVSQTKGFLGVAITEAEDPKLAHLRSHFKGFNPASPLRGSGAAPEPCSVQLVRFDMPVPPPEGSLDRLITDRKELARIEEDWYTAAVASGAPKRGER